MTSEPGASVALLVEGVSRSVHEAAPTLLLSTGACIVLVTARKRKRATLRLVKVSKQILQYYKYKNSVAL